MTADTPLETQHPPSPRLRRLELRLKVLLRRAANSGIRDSDLTIVVLAALIGIAAGFGDVVLRGGVSAFHTLAFDIPLQGHLSDPFPFDWWRVLLVPCAGGGVVGGVAAWIRHRRPHDIVDAIEANALFGGRMSVTDSVNLAITTLLSGGFGASVGLEAAYTQLGASVGSRIGMVLRLRRDDVRTLVGCGAAAAIGAAFNAPLTGAFYAFELIVGSYTLSTLAPVAIAALAGTFTARVTFGAEPIFVVERAVSLTPPDYPLFVLVGLMSALLGIIVMRGVTATEQWFQARSIPRWARPAIGGLVLGIMALIFPQVLGSGHGGIVAALHMAYPLPILGGLVAAKIAASAVSIGAGFRGGLFSAALFMGALLGAAVALLLGLFLPAHPIDPLAFTLVGMGAVGTAIVGAPVAMILLVLECTGDFSATVGVMVGVITASVAVRQLFGYSFATWRFHLRGLKIRGAEDVGWLDELKVGRLMRSDVKLVPWTMTVAELRRAYPLGSTRQVFALDGDRLAGVVELAEVHGPDLPGDPDEIAVVELLHGPPAFLTVSEDVRTALARFGEARIETLPVVDDIEHLKVVGYLTEAYALRRYNQELERRRGEGFGDTGLYSSAVSPRS